MDKITVSNNIIRVETTIPEQVIPERIEAKEYNIDERLRELNRLRGEKESVETNLKNIDSEIAKIEELLSQCKINIPDCPMDATEQIEK